MFLEQDDIEITEELKRELLAGINAGVRARLLDALSDPWHCFEEKEPVGTFSVWLDIEEEIKTTLTLDGLVDRTMATNNVPEFRNALADELDRLASLLRSA